MCGSSAPPAGRDVYCSQKPNHSLILKKKKKICHFASNIHQISGDRGVQTHVLGGFRHGSSVHCSWCRLSLRILLTAIVHQMGCQDPPHLSEPVLAQRATEVPVTGVVPLPVLSITPGKKPAARVSGDVFFFFLSP